MLHFIGLLLLVAVGAMLAFAAFCRIADTVAIMTESNPVFWHDVACLLTVCGLALVAMN